MEQEQHSMMQVEKTNFGAMLTQMSSRNTTALFIQQLATVLTSYGMALDLQYISFFLGDVSSTLTHMTLKH